MVQRKTLVKILRGDSGVMRRNYSRFSNQVDAFNHARKNRGLNHSEDIISGNINLINSDLPGINLENMNLGHSNISKTNFEGANLRSVHFDYTDAYDTIFRNADLRDCRNFCKLDADRADFKNADLRGAHLDKRYDYSLRRLLSDAHFSETLITPEQREQLVSEFGISEDFFESRFIITPRGKYKGGPTEYLHEKGLAAYEKAREEGRIFTEKLNGDTLEYAVIPLQGNEDINNIISYAFSLVKTNSALIELLGSKNAEYEGNWLYFVFDYVPEQFREFTAVHEFGEREGGSHKEATIMEYERAKSKGMLDDYVSWIVSVYPGKLIGDAVYTFTEEEMEKLPAEVKEATKSVMPKSIRTWKKEQENRKHGIPHDVWDLTWEGLSDDEILAGLVRKGYDTNIAVVQHWKEQMEIPDCRAIQNLTYLKPR